MYYSVLLILSSYLFLASAFKATVPSWFFNVFLEMQNPSSYNPPSTDTGAMPPFRYPYAMTHLNSFTGGWLRTLTQADLTISTKLAGALDLLYKDGIRELHWHTVSEWSYVIYGQARITAVDEQGRAFVEDVKAGDFWFFPAGVAHGVQAIGNDSVFWHGVFNGGASNDALNGGITFLLNDWVSHVPREVLSKNFQVPMSVFANLQPKKDMFPGQIPRPSLAAEKAEVTKGTGCVPQSFAFLTEGVKPNATRKGGEALIVDARNFPVTDMASAIVRLKPGAMRELHWHPNGDEWQYYVIGKARMSLFNAGGAARTMDFYTGDVGYVPMSFGHYIENTGKEDLIFVEVFNTPLYEDISLAEWLAHTYPSLVNEHIRTGEPFIRSIPKTKRVIVP